MKTDMLVRRNDGTLARAQCAYLAGQEEARIIETVEKRYGSPKFFPLIGMKNKHILRRKWAIAQYPGREFIIGYSFVTLKNKDLESMYSRALDLVRTTRRASTSWLQRQLNIGYNDALKIISLLEERGVISPSNDNGVREILVEDNCVDVRVMTG